MAKQKIVYTWCETLGLAECKIYYNNNIFVGEAWCHPEDRDMLSKMTGQNIAEFRAMIKSLRYFRDNETKPKLAILKQLYYNMKNSKHFNPKSYEAKMLFHSINLLTKELKELDIEIKNLKECLKIYLERKEKDHQIIREHRKKKELAENN